MELTPDLIKQFVERPFAFIERVGLQALILEPCHIKLVLPLKGNENHIGIMYAGALFTLAEIPGGALYLTTFDVARYYPVVKEMRIRFLKPADTDTTVEVFLSECRVQQIASEAEENGKAEFVIDTELKNDKGDVVAEGSGVYQIRRNPV